MADGIVSDIAGRLFAELGSLVIKESGLAWGVEEEIGKLKDTVEAIQAVLQDAEEQHSKKNEQVTLWLSKLKEVVYDADDLLDDFATELQLREDMAGNRMAKEVRICFSKSNKIAYSLKMGHRIKVIRGKLDAIEENRRFKLDEKPVQSVETQQTHSFVHNVERQTHSFVRADDVIGRDEDKNIIIQRLLESNNVENVSVIPIVGIGGLGKTTLAKLIYNDENIKNNFQLRMWVCVSDVFDVRIIIQNIIKSADGMNNMDQLQKHLLEQISGKKYLLVLDDIWNENRERWLELETLLMNGMKGSMILVTTRSPKVAKITSKLPFHELRGLNEDQSWSLFTKMAFENGIEPNGSELVKIGKFILKKCVGVPLAIRTIARLLYENNNEDYWSHFMTDELCQIVQEENDILPTLKLSYDRLPSHLKQCFAYCALFPKDYIITKDYLVDLWMAQGFLWSSSANRSLEFVGNEYFLNLLSRSFFQDAECDDWGNVINCKMHDLMHDLATKVAGSECNILSIDATNDQAKARHISFDSALDSSREIPTALLDKNHIRTFLLPLRNELNESNFKKILSSSRCLRTLDLIGSNIKKLSNSIGKLKHLRYLDMSGNEEIISLPNSMSRLKNLQILKLNGCYRLEELPKDLRKMVSLRCLMMKGCRSLIGIPSGLSSLTNLRTLSRFVLGRRKSRKYAELYELAGLNDLRGELELEIKGLENARSKHRLANYLKAKNNLNSLTLDWDYYDLDYIPSPDVVSFNEEVLECLQPHPNLRDLRMSYFMGMRISGWLSSLTNLTSIRIYNCRRCQHIPRLDQLPSLQSLSLDGSDDLEYMISANGSNDSSSTPSSTSFFPSLKKLEIRFCLNLKGWWRDVDNDNDDGAMELPSFPCLSQLDIFHCPNLNCMPLYPSLKKLSLWVSGLRPLEQTMKNIATPSTSSTVSAPFSKLKSLYVGACENLDFLTNVDDKQWKGFTSLNSITFSGIDELVSLPQGLQHVPNLQTLDITDCPKLMDLPEGMQLQVLRIGIRICPQLSERYGNKKGVNWPKISHIPNIHFDGEWIQEEGCYILNNTEGCSSASTVS